MPDMPEEKKSYSFLIYVVVLIAIAGLFYYMTRAPAGTGVTPSEGGKLSPAPVAGAYTEQKNPYEGKTEPTVVTEKLKIPVTKKITATSGRAVESNSENIQTPLVPHGAGETVVVPLATYTAKGVYEISLKEAVAWSSDVKLSFIKSLGAVTVDGKSSQWQAVFASAKTPKQSYEVVVQGDAIVSKKAVESAAVGGTDLPKDWYDSDAAFKRLAEMPQFANALVSAISLFYNPDAKAWRYAIVTNLGTTSLAL